MSYASAAEELYKVSLGTFVEERKRLAGNLKAEGDKAGATKLGKLTRPPVSAWTVNQLHWHARAAVDRLFAAADRLRGGDLAATGEHREALAALRTKAAGLLAEGGHNANEATLRRISLTLSALAAAGTWDPELPGHLTTDRDPPGFDAVGVINPPSAPLPEKPVAKPFPFAKPDPIEESIEESIAESEKYAPPVIVKPAKPEPERIAESIEESAKHAPKPVVKHHAPAVAEPANANRAVDDKARRKQEALAKMRKEIHVRLDAANSELDAAEQRVAAISAELGAAQETFEAAKLAVEELRDQLDALD